MIPTGEQIAASADFDAEVATLVTRIQAGEAELFGDLYRRCIDPVYSYLRLMLNDPHEAEDVAQQVFLTLIEKLPAYEDRGQPFRTWLFTVVRNHALNHLRKLKRIDVEDQDAVNRRRNQSPAQLQPLDWLTDADLVTLIERLPIAQRQVLLLRYMLDLKTDDIAAILNRAPTDVRSLQHRALKFLKRRLTALGRAPKVTPQSDWQARIRQAKVVRDRRYALQR